MIARHLHRLALGLVLTACSGCGPQAEPDPGPAARGAADEDRLRGMWRPARDSELQREIARLSEEGLDWEEVQAEIRRLEAIGYATGAEPAPEELGVTLHRREEVEAGLNLYTSGHAPVATLMDMEGNELHSWRCSFERALPGFETTAENAQATFREYFRRCHLFPNGDLLAIFEGQALVKLDKDSELLWTFDGGAHHDLDVLPSGNIYVLTRAASLLPRIHPTDPVLEDFVSILSPDGVERRRVSVLECFEASDHADLLEGMRPSGDVLHTNTIEVLDGRLSERLPAFGAGRVLISCLEIDTIAVVDLELEQVVWARKGTWKKQHQPTVLANGNLMLFDNLGGDPEHGSSRVLELDPVTLETRWLYEGGPGSEFQTDTCGSSIRLENGNTLITESDNGRAFEVNAEGEIVWEFVSPHRAGARQELIAFLLEVTRLPSQPLDWLK